MIKYVLALSLFVGGLTVSYADHAQPTIEPFKLAQTTNPLCHPNCDSAHVGCRTNCAQTYWNNVPEQGRCYQTCAGMNTMCHRQCNMTR